MSSQQGLGCGYSEVIQLHHRDVTGTNGLQTISGGWERQVSLSGTTGETLTAWSEDWRNSLESEHGFASEIVESTDVSKRVRSLTNPDLSFSTLSLIYRMADWWQWQRPAGWEWQEEPRGSTDSPQQPARWRRQDESENTHSNRNTPREDQRARGYREDPMDEVGGKGTRPVPSRNIEFLRGDWKCPKCGDMCFASKTHCWRCGWQRPWIPENRFCRYGGVCHNKSCPFVHTVAPGWLINNQGLLGQTLMHPNGTGYLQDSRTPSLAMTHGRPALRNRGEEETEEGVEDTGGEVNTGTPAVLKTRDEVQLKGNKEGEEQQGRPRTPASPSEESETEIPVIPAKGKDLVSTTGATQSGSNVQSRGLGSNEVQGDKKELETKTETCPVPNKEDEPIAAGTGKETHKGGEKSLTEETKEPDPAVQKELSSDTPAADPQPPAGLPIEKD